MAAKYLVGVDSIEESRTALKLACLKAKAGGGRVDIIHVIPPADFQSLTTVADRIVEEQRAEAEKRVQELCESIQLETGILPTIMLREGNVGDELVSAALADQDAAQLILGVSSQSATSSLIPHIAARLPIALLLVPASLTDQQLEALL